MRKYEKAIERIQGVLKITTNTAYSIRDLASLFDIDRATMRELVMSMVAQGMLREDGKMKPLHEKPCSPAVVYRATVTIIPVEK